jgi:histidine triad (HIT) family protein
VSNNGAKVRIVLYKKGIGPERVAVRPPADLGGVRSPAFAAINPERRMPALVRHGSGSSDEAAAPTPLLGLGESDTICRYLLSSYPDRGPSFLPDHPLSNFLSRIHDVYMAPIQGCMYKADPPFGGYGTRSAAIREYKRQWSIVESLLPPDEDGGGGGGGGGGNGGTTYLLGNEVSLADAALFPSAVFARHMLPKFDEDGGGAGREGSPPSPSPLPPRIEAWYQRVVASDADFARVRDEIFAGLEGWETNRRWDGILGAGWRDTDPSTIFDKILRKEIPASVVMEDEHLLAFRDINPVGPVHVLVIPKDRMGLTRLSRATNEHAEILGRLVVAAAAILRDPSLGFRDGGRIVINDGPDGGQEVPHLHVHVVGGRQMTWPPG